MNKIQSFKFVSIFPYIYVIVPVISRLGNLALIPIALLTFDRNSFVDYGMFFVYSFLTSVTFELGIRQRILKGLIDDKKGFSFFAIKVIILSILCIFLIFVGEKTIRFESGQNFLILYLAIIDGVMSNLISNGLFTFLLRLENTRRFSSFTLSFAIGYFLARLIPLVLKFDLIYILMILILFKITFFLFSFFYIFSKVVDRKISIAYNNKVFVYSSLNSFLSLMIVLVLSIDRIVGAHILTNEQMTFYLLIYQLINGLSTFAEQLVHSKFRLFCSLTEIEAYFSIHGLRSFLGLWFISPWISVWFSNSFNLPFLEVFVTIILQCYTVFLWLVYIAFVNVFNETKHYLKRAVPIHLFVLLLVVLQIFLMLNDGQYTASSLALVPFLGFLCLILLLRFNHGNQKSFARSNIFEQYHWVMLFSILILGVFNFGNFSIIDFLSLICFMSFSISMKFWNRKNSNK